MIKPATLSKILYSLTFLPILVITSCAQSGIDQKKARLIGLCEGCEAIFEYSRRELSPVDTLPDFDEAGMKIRISGTVYQSDGVTPAPGVVLYIYHTNQEGIYENKNKAANWERRHGYIRGWAKTGVNGHYSFYTLKPGVYPSRTEPAHIHLTLLEPDGKYYWLGSYFFEGDPLLTEKDSAPAVPRGGSPGLLSLKKEGYLWTGERDIVLGRNVPGYK